MMLASAHHPSRGLSHTAPPVLLETREGKASLKSRLDLRHQHVFLMGLASVTLLTVLQCCTVSATLTADELFDPRNTITRVCCYRGSIQHCPVHREDAMNWSKIHYWNGRGGAWYVGYWYHFVCPTIGTFAQVRSVRRRQTQSTAHLKNRWCGVSREIEVAIMYTLDWSDAYKQGEHNHKGDVACCTACMMLSSDAMLCAELHCQDSRLYMYLLQAVSRTEAIGALTYYAAPTKSRATTRYWLRAHGRIVRYTRIRRKRTSLPH